MLRRAPTSAFALACDHALPVRCKRDGGDKNVTFSSFLHAASAPIETRALVKSLAAKPRSNLRRENATTNLADNAVPLKSRAMQTHSGKMEASTPRAELSAEPHPSAMTREVASPSSSGKVKVEASQNDSRTARNACLEPDTGLGPRPTEQDPPKSDAPVVATCNPSLRVLVLDCASDAHLPGLFEHLSSHYPSDAPLPFDLVLGTGAAALPAVLVGRLGLAPNQAAAAREQVLLLLHQRDGTLPATSGAREQSKNRWADWFRLGGGREEESRKPSTPASAPRPDRAVALERALSTALPATREGFAHPFSDQKRPRTALLLQDADDGPSRSGWLCEETDSGEDPAAGVTIARAVAQTHFKSTADSAPDTFLNDAVAFANRIARDTPSILHFVAGNDGRFAAKQDVSNVRCIFLDTERRSDNERASSSTDRAASVLAAPSVNGDAPLTGTSFSRDVLRPQRLTAYSAAEAASRPPSAREVLPALTRAKAPRFRWRRFVRKARGGT